MLLFCFVFFSNFFCFICCLGIFPTPNENHIDETLIFGKSLNDRNDRLRRGRSKERVLDGIGSLRREEIRSHSKDFDIVNNTSNSTSNNKMQDLYGVDSTKSVEMDETERYYSDDDIDTRKGRIGSYHRRPKSEILNALKYKRNGYFIPEHNETDVTILNLSPPKMTQTQSVSPQLSAVNTPTSTAMNKNMDDVGFARSMQKAQSTGLTFILISIAHFEFCFVFELFA